MAYEEDEPQPLPAAAPSPALQQFRAAFTDPTAAQWADEATVRLNDYFTKRQLAAQNTRAGQNFERDIDSFQNGLVGFVKADPNAVHVALDLVHPTMAALIGTIPGVENADEHHAALTDGISKEIAAAALTSAAERSEPLARHMLGDERLKGILGDDAHASLTTYTDMQAGARRDDQAAQQIAAAQARTDVTHRSAINYLGALINPRTGDLQFPDGWNQGVLADLRLPPAATHFVSSVYQSLRENGDAPQSDPFVAARIIGQMAQNGGGEFDRLGHTTMSGEGGAWNYNYGSTIGGHLERDPFAMPQPGVEQNDNPPMQIVRPQSDLTPADILGHAGNSLRLADALHLAGLSMGGENWKPHLAALNAAAQYGERTLATPGNGAAGEAAFGRYMNWLLPAARNGAVLDPAHPEYALGGQRMQQFAPKIADAADSAVDAEMLFQRPTLPEIFHESAFRSRAQGEIDRPSTDPNLNPDENLRIGIPLQDRFAKTPARGTERTPPPNATRDRIPTATGRMNDLEDLPAKDRDI